MKKDFEKYLVTVQKQHNDMQKALEEAQKLAQEGQISAKIAKNIKAQADIIEANYQRLLYCRHLYMLPPKFIQNIKKKKFELEQKKFFEQKADELGIKEENQKAIDELNKTVEKVKEQNNG